VQREAAGYDALHTLYGRRQEALAGVLGAQGDGGIQGDAAAEWFFDSPEGFQGFVNGRKQQSGA